MSFKDLGTAHKVQLVISFILRLSMAIAMIGAGLQFQWFTFFVTGIILFLTFLPSIITRNYKIILPIEFDLITVIFIYMALFLGEIKEYYFKHWWWDIALHTLAGVVLGFIGLVIVYLLMTEKKVRTKPLFAAYFAFAFAVTLGVLWEIFEFGMDQAFGLNMQKSGLMDTMWDLIVDTVGAIFASVIGYFYLKDINFLNMNILIKKIITKYNKYKKYELKKLFG